MSENNGKATKATTTTIHASAEAARSAKPADHPKYKLWKIVGKDDGAWFLYARSKEVAVAAVASSQLGLTAVSCDRRPANPETVDGLLASLSDTDRAALLAKYLGTGGSAPAASTPASTGGKKTK
jgi:hypothetical protein